LKLGTISACCFQTLRNLTQHSETQCQEVSHGRLLKSSQGVSLCNGLPCPFHHCLIAFRHLPVACLVDSFDHDLTACITCFWLPCPPSCLAIPALCPCDCCLPFTPCLLLPSYSLFFWPFPCLSPVLFPFCCCCPFCLFLLNSENTSGIVIVLCLCAFPTHPALQVLLPTCPVLPFALCLSHSMFPSACNLESHSAAPLLSHQRCIHSLTCITYVTGQTSPPPAGLQW